MVWDHPRDFGPEPDPLIAALEHVESPRIAFVENDDWYAANWLEMVHHRLRNADIAGESSARDYSATSR